MSFVHKTALLMTVRSVSFMRALQVFCGICVTRFVEVSLRKWYVFYITVLKIIYVYDNEAHGIYETYTRNWSPRAKNVGGKHHKKKINDAANRTKRTSTRTSTGD
jgi:hypothetical protein